MSSKKIGKRIRRLRHHLTQLEYAKKLGISLPALQNYESGKRIPRGDVLRKIAEFGKMPVDWILRGERCDVTMAEIKERVLHDSYVEGEEKPSGEELEKRIDLYIKEHEVGQLRAAEAAASYGKPRIKEITELLNDMNSKDVEEVFRLVQDKKQAAEWRREHKLKKGA